MFTDFSIEAIILSLGLKPLMQYIAPAIYYYNAEFLLFFPLRMQAIYSTTKSQTSDHYHSK